MYVRESQNAYPLPAQVSKFKPVVELVLGSFKRLEADVFPQAVRGSASAFGNNL